MENPAISIIVPVFNAEKTLRECMDSILIQSYQNFELILIDDGSKDHSPAICDEYANIDERIIVIHKSNAGVSTARNKGLEIAKGKWITFIDSDDYISADFFQGIDCCKQQLLITGFRDEKERKVYENVKMSSAIYQESKEMRKFIRSQVSSNMVLRGPWGKFYLRDLIGTQRFNINMKLGEDTCFVFDYLAKCHSIEVNASSYYVIRRGTIPDEIKYKSTVDYAVCSLNSVWESFKKMNIVHQIGVGRFYTYIGYYKLMCKHEWKQNLASWYHNPQVYRMYQYVSQDISFFIIIKFHLIRFLSLFVNKI